MLPEFHLHPDVLSLVVLLAGGWWYLETRFRPLVAPTAAPATSRQWWAWYGGVFTMFVAAGWPMHDIAEQSLFTFHMLEHLLIGYVVPPLLLLGMPRWMADWTIGRPAVARVVRTVARPAAGFFAFNILLVAIHWPLAIEWQNTNEWTHFVVHLAFFTAAMCAWLPIFSPTAAIERVSEPVRMLVLFLMTIIPTVPASFLTFSDVQLYPVYGDAALAWGLTPVEDQTIAGIVMKLGGGFYLLAIIAGTWFRWIARERAFDEIERHLITTE